jgi:hypothetical protein
VGDDMQGHYIIFEILVQDKAKLKADQNVRKKKIFLDQDSTDRAATLASNTAAQAAVTAAEKAAEKIAGHAYHNATRSGGGGESGIISLSAIHFNYQKKQQLLQQLKLRYICLLHYLLVITQNMAPQILVQWV